MSRSKRAKLTATFVRSKDKTTVKLNMIGKGLSFGYYEKKLGEILDEIKDSITEDKPVKEKKSKSGKFCPECGSKITDSDKFCSGCGKKQ